MDYWYVPCGVVLVLAMLRCTTGIALAPVSPNAGIFSKTRPETSENVANQPRLVQHSQTTE